MAPDAGAATRSEVPHPPPAASHTNVSLTEQELPIVVPDEFVIGRERRLSHATAIQLRVGGPIDGGQEGLVATNRPKAMAPWA
jgi:hypothetical protein